jgi:malonate-semialdehyde dehydrogenase (acetylating)/methylmalonate-semialdehyde dehydrogenase
MKITKLATTSFINGEPANGGGEVIPVLDPATGTRVSELALATVTDVDEAVAAAASAAPAWAATPVLRRAQLLSALSRLIAERADELAPVITLDNGKGLTDARAELARAIDHLEAASTVPALWHGYGSTDVAPGLDTSVIREPLGVCAVIAPFNFPIMTGLIYWAWALACGNTVVLKPSEQAPAAATLIAGLMTEAGFAPGVFNVLQGGREAAEALCDHPGIASVSIVGSTAAARAVYGRATQAGKRAHAAGGARNMLVVAPDADLDTVIAQTLASAFAMSGQRCLSGSILVQVGDAHPGLAERLAKGAWALRVGSGFDPASDVPPLISAAAVDKVAAALDAAYLEGASVLLDGRHVERPAEGFFVGPSVIDRVDLGGPLTTGETFGPLLSIGHVADLDAALAAVNGSPFGNAASIFTRDGSTARSFALGADVGNVGVNVGVAAPNAQFGFGGRRRSFFGTVHSQGPEAVQFYTDPKSIITRW